MPRREWKVAQTKRYRDYIAEQPREQVLRDIEVRQTPSGRFTAYRVADPEMLGFFWIVGGVTVAIFLMVTLGFAFADGEWSGWHWGILMLLGGIPFMLTLLLGAGVVSNLLQEYSHYRDLLAVAEEKGWR